MMVQVTGSLLSMSETQSEIPSSLAWFSLGCQRHLGSEPMNGVCLSFCLQINEIKIIIINVKVYNLKFLTLKSMLLLLLLLALIIEKC